MSAELRSAPEWCALRGLYVLDPDGWRDGTRTWHEPITEAEFRGRFARSTVRFDCVARDYLATDRGTATLGQTILAAVILGALFLALLAIEPGWGEAWARIGGGR